MSNSLVPQPLQTARHHSEFSFSKPHTTVSFSTTAASISTLQRKEGSERTYRGPHLVGARTLSVHLLGSLVEGREHPDIPAPQQACALMHLLPLGIRPMGRGFLTKEEPSCTWGLCVRDSLHGRPQRAGSLCHWTQIPKCPESTINSNCCLSTDPNGTGSVPLATNSGPALPPTLSSQCLGTAGWYNQ